MLFLVDRKWHFGYNVYTLTKRGKQMKTYQEVISEMVKNEAFKIALEGPSTLFYPGIHMVSFVYDVSTKQIEKDVKAGLTPEALKLGKQAYKYAQSKLRG